MRQDVFFFGCLVAISRLLLSVIHASLARLPVVDENGKLVGILSQSRLVRFLGQHVKQFDFGSLTIKQTNLGVQCAFSPFSSISTLLPLSDRACRKVIAVSAKDKVATALAEIKSRKVSAVAVVDDNGVLVGNFSATDLKALGYEDDIATIAGLDPLSKFVDKVKASAPDDEYPIAVEKTATTASVIKKFASAGVHRIYVVDAMRKPVGIVSLVDIIELFIRHILIE